MVRIFFFLSVLFPSVLLAAYPVNLVDRELTLIGTNGSAVPFSFHAGEFSSCQHEPNFMPGFITDIFHCENRNTTFTLQFSTDTIARQFSADRTQVEYKYYKQQKIVQYNYQAVETPTLAGKPTSKKVDLMVYYFVKDMPAKLQPPTRLYGYVRLSDLGLSASFGKDNEPDPNHVYPSDRRNFTIAR